MYTQIIKGRQFGFLGGGEVGKELEGFEKKYSSSMLIHVCSERKKYSCLISSLSCTAL